MTPQTLRMAVQNALDFLMDEELVLFTNQVVAARSRVTWGAADAFAFSDGLATVSEYLSWVRSGQYSAVMVDGSLLQLTYDFDGHEVQGHRLAYVPCPVAAPRELLLESPICDSVEAYLEGGVDAIKLRSPMRFDYDSRAAGPGHPASHFTFNAPACRIACVSPVHPGRFFAFVYRQFYPDLASRHPVWFEQAAQTQLGRRTLPVGEHADFHLNWPLDRLASEPVV